MAVADCCWSAAFVTLPRLNPPRESWSDTVAASPGVVVPLRTATVVLPRCTLGWAAFALVRVLVAALGGPSVFCAFGLAFVPPPPCVAISRPPTTSRRTSAETSAAPRRPRRSRTVRRRRGGAPPAVGEALGRGERSGCARRA